jgi:hypothetical protein
MTKYHSTFLSTDGKLAMPSELDPDFPPFSHAAAVSVKKIRCSTAAIAFIVWWIIRLPRGFLHL